MTILEWLFGIILLVIYLFCLFTVCITTFRKGHWFLGILGFFTVLAWLVGAILPAKPGSKFARDQALEMQEALKTPTDRAA